MISNFFVVYPQDTNALKMDMVFGGKLMSEFDKIAVLCVKQELLENNLDKSIYAVTVGVDKLSFYRPAFVGDVINLGAEICSYGKTSIKVKVHAVVEYMATGEIKPMANGYFTFCTVKRDGFNNIPVEHGLQ